MPWNGRVYFVSDRDGSMNIWSMAENGRDLRQHTKHREFDVQSPSLSKGRIVYQMGADLRLLDIVSGADKPIPVTLVSDFDHLRERWVKNAIDWVSSAHLSPNGDRVVLTARGQVFIAPALQGRIVEATRNPLARHRNARFMPDGQTVLSLSDEGGEVEFWRVPANGVGAPAQLSNDAKVLRWDGVPSPDGNYVANHDKNQRLWILDVAKKAQKQVGRVGQRKLRRHRLVARQSVAGLHLPGGEPVDACLPLRSGNSAQRPGDDGPLRQREPGVEPGRQVALLPVEPELRVAGRQPLGVAAARAVLRPADEDLPRRPEARRTLAVPGGRRAAARREVRHIEAATGDSAKPADATPPT